ncbi:MAG: hypothetical protein WDZ59_04660 [Pirellulales bacterium]
MPSDPSQPHATERLQDDFDLPDNLAALSEQLAADAARLAERYPALHGLHAKLPAAQTQTLRQRVWRWSARAASLAAIVAGAWWTAGQFEVGGDRQAQSSARSTASQGVHDASQATLPSPRADQRQFVSADVPTSGRSSSRDRPANHSQAVSAGPEDLNPPPLRRGSEVELLNAQLQAYQSVIEAMQEELARREAQQAKTEEQLELLRRQVADLEQRIERQER